MQEAAGTRRAELCIQEDKALLYCGSLSWYTISTLLCSLRQHMKQAV